MGANQIDGRIKRVHIHMPGYMGREVKRIMDRDVMKPSQFFRCLFDQARAANLPIFKAEAK